jgi:hypothetical protein
VMRISRELNLEDDMVFAPSLSPWIHHAGKLHPLPGGKFFGPGGVLNFVLFDDLLSWRGKSRAFMGAILGHAPPPRPPRWRRGGDHRGLVDQDARRGGVPQRHRADRLWHIRRRSHQAEREDGPAEVIANGGEGVRRRVECVRGAVLRRTRYSSGGGVEEGAGGRTERGGR